MDEPFFGTKKIPCDLIIIGKNITVVRIDFVITRSKRLIIRKNCVITRKKTM